MAGFAAELAYTFILILSAGLGLLLGRWLWPRSRRLAVAAGIAAWLLSGFLLLDLAREHPGFGPGIESRLAD